ncbi:ABC transporter G family member 26-like isoform X2 [Miscanthus floridulus]|uniref:ABC transporter G family member 26-like isoform X2 n=1 Tax=Miscanthus floridulus TaxID=154761 RepID=UPI003457B187
MEMSDERMEITTVECQHLPPSWQGNGDADAEVEVEEDHLWPTKDGPLPIFLKFENVEYRVKMTLKNPLTAVRVAFASQMTVDQGSSCKHILKGIAGSVDPGEILALMGPSGSGKTTLLKILGGRLDGGIKGQITYNDTPYSPCLKRRIGFVTQDDVLFPQLTVEETLVFAAFLRLPACMSKQQKRDRVDAIITELNLERCRHTKIGGAFVRGVSGGERKRTSIGNEILVDPTLLLLDEPTSGLDSTSASKLILVLQRLAKTRRTIITTIHQPSSRMFYMFDKLLLISDGHAIYHGKARDCMHHFSSLGFVPEIPMNPAEFLLDLATGNLDDISVPEALRGSPDPQEFRSQVIRHLQVKFRAGGGAGAGGRSRVPPTEQLRLALRARKDHRRSIGWLQQFTVLSRRTFRERASDYLDKMRLAQAVGVALLLGLLWWKSQTGNEAQLRDQVGLIFYICIFWTSSSLFGSVYVFPFEKLYLVKERKADMYRLSAYYASSSLCDAVPHVVYLPGHRGAAGRRHPQRQEGWGHGVARAHALPPHRRLLRPAHPQVHPLAQVRLLHALRLQPAAQSAVPRPPHVQLRQPGRLPAPAVVAVVRHRGPRRRHARGLDPARHGARLPIPRLLLPPQADYPHALVITNLPLHRPVSFLINLGCNFACRCEC